MLGVRSEGLKWYFLFLMSGLICLFFVYAVELSLIIPVIIAFILFSVFWVDFDPTHPVSWFLPALFIYHFAAPIADWIGLRLIHQPMEVARIGWIAICTSAWVLFLLDGSRKDDMDREDLSHYMLLSPWLPRLVFLLLIGGLVYDIWFLRAGFRSKRSFVLLAGNLGNLKIMFSWLLLGYGGLLTKALYYERRVPKVLILYVGIFLFFSALLLGERDLIFSYLLITSFLLSSTQVLKKSLVYGISSSMLLLVPLLSSLKNAFTRTVIWSDVSVNLLERLLIGEFFAVGKNISVIVTAFGARSSHSFFLGETLLWDLSRSFIPGFISEQSNATSWFNRTFFPTTFAAGGGHGFSLSAEGLINFGVVGVVIWYVVTCSIIMFIYKRKSIIGKVMYFVAIPFFIYAIRGDLSYIFSPFVKHLALPVFLLYVLSRIEGVFGRSVRLRVDLESVQ